MSNLWHHQSSSIDIWKPSCEKLRALLENIPEHTSDYLSKSPQVTKRGTQLIIFCQLSSCSFEYRESRHFITKRTQNPTQHSSIYFCNRIAKASVSAEIGKKTVKSLTHRWKGPIPNKEATTFTMTLKCKKCIYFPSFMSEQYLSTRSKTYTHLERFKFQSSHRRSETQIRHQQGQQRAGATLVAIRISNQQGQQRAGATLVAIRISKNSTVAVNWVEHPLTISMKNTLAKNVFWRSIQKFKSTLFAGTQTVRGTIVGSVFRLHW